MNEDRSHHSKYYASLMGVSLENYGKMERFFCDAIEYSLHISNNKFFSFLIKIIKLSPINLFKKKENRKKRLSKK